MSNTGQMTNLKTGRQIELKYTNYADIPVGAKFIRPHYNCLLSDVLHQGSVNGEYFVFTGSKNKHLIHVKEY